MLQLTSALAPWQGTTTDVGEKKKISEKIKALLKSSAPPPPASIGMPKPQSPFSKEYTQMKMAFCATNRAGGEAMCSTATSQNWTGCDPELDSVAAASSC